MSEQPIRVILADDHQLVLEGLATLLERTHDIRVVAAVTDGDDLLEALERQEADVVVLDLEMPYHGFTALSEIRRRNLPVRVLVLTAFADGESMQTAIELEADGFVPKTESPRQTIMAIRQVAAGMWVYPRAVQRMVFRTRGGDVALSQSEWKVLEQVAMGKTNAQIAETLHVSKNTVRFHLKNIFEKLHVANRTEATAWYFKHRTRYHAPSSR
ncbi:MAG TPA: response regulator transcription factor [Anaerolineae bacterium]|nr:response regulator transcription factor [Caldilineae bacterium]HID35192.1 response regulator transcription factor [Anaerolineae bacterium]HIQ12482.1 response regulator transcription factor [Caldilineales bacterium]